MICLHMKIGARHYQKYRGPSCVYRMELLDSAECTDERLAETGCWRLSNRSTAIGAMWLPKEYNIVTALDGKQCVMRY